MRQRCARFNFDPLDALKERQRCAYKDDGNHH
jgi:hypothetical protein